jgi:glycosyltransferase 2 family protein
MQRSRGLYVSLLLSLVTIGLVLYFTWDEETLVSLEMLKPQGLLAAFLLVLCLWLVEGLRIKSLLKAVGSTARLPLLAASRVFLITYFWSGISPLGMAEWPAHILALSRREVSPGEAAAAALLRTLYTKGVFAVWSGIIIFFYNSLGVQVSTGRIFKGAFTAIALTSLAYFLIILKPGLVVSLLGLIQKFPFTRHLYEQENRVTLFLRALLKEAQHFRLSLKHVWDRGPLWFLSPLLLTLVYWTLYFSIAPLILWSFGMTPPFMTSVSWQVMIFLILFYVPLPGGSGAAEFSAATLFVGFVPSPIIGVFIAAWRFFTYYLTLFCGGLAFLSLVRYQR